MVALIEKLHIPNRRQLAKITDGDTDLLTAFEQLFYTMEQLLRVYKSVPLPTPVTVTEGVTEDLATIDIAAPEQGTYLVSYVMVVKIPVIGDSFIWRTSGAVVSAGDYRVTSDITDQYFPIYFEEVVEIGETAFSLVIEGDADGVGTATAIVDSAAILIQRIE